MERKAIYLEFIFIYGSNGPLGMALNGGATCGHIDTHELEAMRVLHARQEYPDTPGRIAS